MGSVFWFVYNFSLSVCPRAQDIFRQAMKSHNITLEVVPPYNREQYEKSVIASLYSADSVEHVSKAKVPPPIHPKPITKAADNLETGVRTVLHPVKSPNLPRLSRKPSSPTLSPLMGFGSKRNAKKIRIDLKKGNVLREAQIYKIGNVFLI